MFLLASAATAQTLPRGVGAVQLGFRNYQFDGYVYDDDGRRTLLSERYAQALDGRDLLAGKAGDELARLAGELDRLDPHAARGASLVDRLRLGRVAAKVDADIAAKYLGVAYGLTPRLSLFGALPYVSARSRASLSYQGTNNAQALKQELGALAYDELAAGLDEAAAIDQKRIERAFGELGYAPLGDWRRDGIGDAQLGVKTAAQTQLPRGTRAQHGLDVALSLPTGYRDDPDILQDVGFGSGYFGLGATGSEKVRWQRWGGYADAGGSLLYRKNFDAKVARRVPERGGGSLVEASRKRDVALDPGDDVELAASGAVGWQVVELGAERGIKRHYRDRYSGALDGDYDALADGSDKTLHFVKLSLNLDTTDAYVHKRFPAPFLAGFAYFQTLSARNSFDERYFELTLTGFFAAR